MKSVKGAILILLLLSGQPLIGEKSSNLKIPIKMELSLEDQNSLAKFIIRCEKNSADLDSYKKAYDDCRNAPGSYESWWQNPYVIVGGLSVSLATGVLLGVLLK